MATSAYQNTVYVMDILAALEPASILDVGAGFGKWGFLSRCHLGEGHSLTLGKEQRLKIDSIEVFQGNINPVYDAVYNRTYIGDAGELVPSLGKYDVIICGDMVEHLKKDDGLRLIEEMKKHAAKALILSLPLGECVQGERYGNRYEIHQSTWYRGDFHSTGAFLKEFKCHGDLRVATVVFPMNDHCRWVIKFVSNPLRRWAYSILDVMRGKRSSEEIFTEICHENAWGEAETLSGPGSTMENTAGIRKALPEFLKKRNLRTMLDIPCGDFNWMKEVTLEIDQYIGADIVGDIIDVNNSKYAAAGSKRIFRKLDITTDALPCVDLVLCRDGLVHLSSRDVLKAVGNIKRSGSKYLLATTYVARDGNMDIQTGQWRPLNMSLPPFNFPEPEELIDEEHMADKGCCSDRRLGLWLISSLP